MNSLQLRTAVIETVMGLLLVLFALAIGTQIELAVGTLLLIPFIVA